MNEQDRKAFEDFCDSLGQTGYSLKEQEWIKPGAFLGWQACCKYRDGMVGEPVAQSRGWALLGTGRYVLSHTNDFHPELGAELIITFATEEDTQGNRQIGEVRDNPNCGKPIEAKDMIIRIGFLNERALFSLENQLSLLRKQHFPDSATPPATQINRALLDVCEMVALIQDGHFKPPHLMWHIIQKARAALQAARGEV